MKERLVPVVCDRCGRTVAWAIPGALAWCRSCGRWTKPAKANRYPLSEKPQGKQRTGGRASKDPGTVSYARG